MNRVNIYRAVTNDQTSISNLFIDEYMADANDAQLKIYLFLIRMMNANLPTSVTDIADKFNYTEKDVLRSLTYWESRQLLALDFDAAHNLSGIRVLSLENTYEAPRTAPRITPVLSFIRPASMQTGMTARAVTAPMAADRTAAAGSQPANGKYGSSDRELYPFMLDAKISLHDINPGKKFSLIFGNEAAGLPAEFASVGTSVIIPHSADIDSLNLPIAASIAMYEATRQIFGNTVK